EDERGLTTLQWAVRHGYVDAARCLLDRGARADTPGRDGSTALQIAATSGHREMLKLLREHGADVGVGDHSGRTALHSAATSGQLDTVRELLASGANIDATTSEGWTPLMGAAVHADLDTVKLLVEHGADCQSKGPGGLAVTDIAARAGNDGIVAYLRERGVPEGVMTSLASGDVEAIADGLNHGGDPNERVDGDPLICLAAERGQAGVVKLLLGRGADPSARDAENGPALMLAVEYGHDEIAEMLIKAGADVNAREPEERGTALHQVAAVTDARIATLLLERGANVNAKLRDGTRPLDLAEIQTSDEVEDLLREAGAKPGSKGGNRPVGCFAAAMLCGAAVAIVCLLT
ncbi:MAG TPA: ankyrin repeat domain-containing protein, partial [Armatimonadota bacterium]|nr:ankyrin repeat domain-containing protein [Armatimonadota bacterium]